MVERRDVPANVQGGERRRRRYAAWSSCRVDRSKASERMRDDPGCRDAAPSCTSVPSRGGSAGPQLLDRVAGRREALAARPPAGRRCEPFSKPAMLAGRRAFAGPRIDRAFGQPVRPPGNDTTAMPRSGTSYSRQAHLWCEPPPASVKPLWCRASERSDRHRWSNLSSRPPRPAWELVQSRGDLDGCQPDLPRRASGIGDRDPPLAEIDIPVYPVTVGQRPPVARRARTAAASSTRAAALSGSLPVDRLASVSACRPWAAGSAPTGRRSNSFERR